MASAIDRVLKYVEKMLATEDRMPTTEEVESFLANGPKLSAAERAKLVADYKRQAPDLERMNRMGMKYLPLIRKGRNRAI
jgi:hypothetical protein